MGKVLVNKKTVRHNKALKIAQKEAKKTFGRCRGVAPKASINKLVRINYSGIENVNGEKRTSNQETDLPEMSAETLIELVKKAGLTGLSGNGYSTAAKLRTYYDAVFGQNAVSEQNVAPTQSVATKQKVLIVNAVECDPGLVHDEWLLLHKQSELVDALAFMMRTFDFDRILVASKYPENSFRFFGKVEYHQVPNRYPMGQEQKLIENLLGINIEGYPAKQGVLVMNLQTLLTIREIVLTGKWESRYITVADLTTGDAKTVKVKLGENTAKVLQKELPIDTEKQMYIGNGAMTSELMTGEEVISGTTNLLAYAELPDYENAGRCKGCGGCTAKCPMKIDVKVIVSKLEKGDRSGLKEYHLENCVGCGACTYVCAAGKDLRAMIAEVKLN